MTRRIKLVVAYDGTDFCGWAAQPGQRTVQSTLKEAVRQVSGEDCEIVGASRTDSGAHAEGQVCHFDTGKPIEDGNWLLALNRLMPQDLAVLDAKKVSSAFHSRFCADYRLYRYRFLIGTRDPFRARYTFGHWAELNVEAMQRAGQALLGEHDFRAFTEELDPSVENTVRRLFRVSVEKKRDEICIEIAGTAFLRGMMRRIAGCLFEVGRGKRPEEHTGLLLTKERERMHLPVVLPAKGLTLVKVVYGRHPRDRREF